MLSPMKTITLLGFVCVFAVGCGDDEPGAPVDVSGSYTVAVTAGDNGCEFDNWMEGNSTPNIPLTMTQNGAEATADIEGLVGGWLDLVLGSSEYTGLVDGNHLELTLYGTTNGTTGNCTWTVNSTLDATLEGDFLEGELRNTKATNGNPDCTPFEGCVSRQSLNGTRPPQ